MAEFEETQRNYYKETASNYDLAHADGSHDVQHDFALKILLGVLLGNGFRSVLDVGTGTGRAIMFLKKHAPDIEVVGVEPVQELRNIGFKKGISPDILIEGDAYHLPFADNRFDIVTAFGLLHHVKNPKLVVEEMLRAGKRGIFLSDSNNFGQGSFLSRTLKQTVHALGVWKAINFIRTGGKGYQISGDDGLFYSYSVFDNYAQIKRACPKVHIINTEDSGNNLYRTSGHIALLGLK